MFITVKAFFVQCPGFDCRFYFTAGLVFVLAVAEFAVRGNVTQIYKPMSDVL